MESTDVDEVHAVLLRPYQLSEMKEHYRLLKSKATTMTMSMLEEKKEENMQETGNENKDKDKDKEGNEKKEKEIITNHVHDNINDNNIQSLSIGGYYRYSHFIKVIQYPMFSKIQSLVIGACCFESSIRFTLNNLPSLQQLTVYEHSFTDQFFKNVNGTFIIQSCPKLCDVVLGNNTFRGYSKIQFMNLESLKTIRMGNGVFYSAQEFELIRMLE